MIPLIALHLLLSVKSIAHTIAAVSDQGPERALVHVQDCKGLPQAIFEDRNLIVPHANVFWTADDGTAVYFSPTSYLIETVSFADGRQVVTRNCPYKK